MSESYGPDWTVALFAVMLTLAWPLLLGARGPTFEGIRRRELVMIAVGMAVWGAVAWAIFPSSPGVSYREVVT